MKLAAGIGVSSFMKPRPRKSTLLSHEEIAELRARSRQIGKLLHIAFDEVAQEPVPSEFLDLLGRLEEREKLNPKPKLSCH